MSTYPAADLSPQLTTWARRVSQPQRAAFAAGLAVLGLTSIRSTVLFLWDMWTTDALKSIGMLIPVVSFVLILRAWRLLDWEMNGSWWGAALLIVTVATVSIRDHAVLVLVLTPKWNIYIPPHSLVAFAYVSGAVLLFGGMKLYRAALFPIVLIWFVNPVPHIFNVMVDLPLQQVSAHVARAFARMLGQPLTPDQMRLMFTPNFGMFIAPGCNGIRGAVTMGFVALVAGHVCRFRRAAHVATVCGAVLLGYIFNFVRLCLLVVYYIIALHVPRLQNKAKLADYIIGACLFLLATQILFSIIRRFGEKAWQSPQTKTAHAITQQALISTPLRFAVMTLLAVFGCFSTARAVMNSGGDLFATHTSTSLLGAFPEKIGEYHLVRTWNENDTTGTLLFHWGEYATQEDSHPISFGIAPIVGTHNTMICHSARGEDPLWRDQINVATAGGNNVSFSAALFNNGASQTLEVSTVCNGSHCGEYSTDNKKFGLIYSKPDAYALLSSDPNRPIPILLKAETLDTSLPPEEARKALQAEATAFLRYADFHELLKPYQHSRSR